MKSKFGKNSRKTGFLETYTEKITINCDLRERSRFNLSYFDSEQEAGICYTKIPPEKLSDIFEKLKWYSTSSLNHWRNQRCGGERGLRILSDYDTFPNNSDFVHPKFVPDDVRWGRFRMENMFRLIGFTVPPKLLTQENKLSSDPFDANTFYIVFLDPDHRFYKTEKK